ncbi:hypothetical protein [Rhodoplanes roseus]|uniref:Uncharacterized protein n=1 Tax=Rhodoplanes roseus TaxID=29409 RepID=A0A327KQZ2_9BRAD|nr:hypothetical protein [Rhodoplanes roseus]RAI41370.1 hypothetical protein CH341_21820 [Rhodoplanes roseus]
MSQNRSDESRPDRSERPRAEPEIIPPGAPDPRPADREAGPEGFPGAVFITVDQDGRTRYTKIEPPGPLSIAVGLLVLGAIVGAILLVALGMVLFWVPVIVVTIAVLLFSSYLKAVWRRFMGR